MRILCPSKIRRQLIRILCCKFINPFDKQTEKTMKPNMECKNKNFDI